MLIGNKVQILTSCPSTNTFLKEKLDKNIINGEVVCALSQTDGKGQRGNIWESEPNENLTFSFYLEPELIPVTEQFTINYFVSLGVYHFLSMFVPDIEKLKLKWPNDIYYNDKKIGGILIENHVKNNKLKNVIIGIGLNVNQDFFVTNRATSIFIESKEKYDIKEALGMLLEKLNKTYCEFNRNNPSDYKLLYLCKLLGFNKLRRYKDISSQSIFYAKLINVENNGLLVLKTDSEVKKYALKEVAFLWDE